MYQSYAIICTTLLLFLPVQLLAAPQLDKRTPTNADSLSSTDALGQNGPYSSVLSVFLGIKPTATPSSIAGLYIH
jgi:hypothetical protein